MKVTRKYRRICDIVGIFGGKVVKADLQGHDGLLYGDRIVIRKGMSEEESAFAAAHELAHAILHGGDVVEDFTMQAQAETEADDLAESIVELVGMVIPWNADLGARYTAEFAAVIKNKTIKTA